MDKAISVRFYRVTGTAHQEAPFLQRLAQVGAIPEGQRIRKIAELDFWLDKMSLNGIVATGRLCRKQSNHLPLRALPDGRLMPLGVPAIGLNSIWQYDSSLSVIAIEVMRNGASLQKLLTYIRNICNCSGYAYLPVLDDAALVAARSGRIRELAVRVATPRNLHTIAADQQRVKQGMVELMGSEIATQVEVKFSVAAKSPDIQPGTFMRIENWFREEKGADRGTISKLQARIVEENGSASTIDLLDAHLGARMELDLPDDDPDRSAEIRLNNVSSVFDIHRDVLQDQFGR